MLFVAGGKRYSAQYIDHLENSKPSYYSERDYGRYGFWFGKQERKQDGKPIEIRYCIWLQDGEMTPIVANALAQDFQSAPVVTVK